MRSAMGSPDQYEATERVAVSRLNAEADVITKSATTCGKHTLRRLSDVFLRVSADSERRFFHFTYTHQPTRLIHP